LEKRSLARRGNGGGAVEAPALLASAARAAGGHAPFVELVRSRLIEFCREPEALFWVYGFPLVMILSLGIAFRQQPLASLSVDIVAGPHAEADAAALASAAGLTATIRPQADALERLRTGRADLVVERTADTIEFRADPTRPEAALARDRAHDALERAAGRRDLPRHEGGQRRGVEGLGLAGAGDELAVLVAQEDDLAAFRVGVGSFSVFVAQFCQQGVEFIGVAVDVADHIIGLVCFHDRKIRKIWLIENRQKHKNYY
jgi:hypothetical protein